MNDGTDDAMPICGQCCYFRPGAPPAVASEAYPGSCLRHAPGGNGWPQTESTAWCGDWGGRDAGRSHMPMEVMLTRLDGVVDRLSQLDERLTAVEYSVTAAQFEINRKDV